MPSLLQGFEEVNLPKPIGKTVMTVTETVVRFNKSTAAVLGYPSHVKVLINERTQQIALTPATAKETNAVKFSKPADKQTASVSVKEATLVAAITKYFEFAEAPDNEIAYQSVEGAAYPNDKTVIFDAAKAESGTMKRRGRKKAEPAEAETEAPAEPAAE